MAAHRIDEDVDLEKKEEPFVSASAYDEDSAASEQKTAVASRTGGLWSLTHKLAQYGVEEQGIERFDETQRNHKQVYTLFTMWFTTNCTISTMSLGTLGASIWYLGFRDAFLTILFFNLLGSIPASIMSVMGCRTGMRQLAMSRYFFGYYTNAIPIVLNCLACIGWSCVNAIVGGLALSAVNYDSSLPTLPVSAAIVIIAIGTLVVSFMGYRVVHIYEKYSWIPPFICFIIFAVEVAKHGASGQDWGGSGEIEAASVLSFGAAIVGFSLGWVSLAADYSCQLPENTSGIKIFAYTYAGIALPCILLETLGAAAMTTFQSSPFISDAFDSLGLGGLLAATLIEPLGGFGRFVLIILGLSIIGNNIPNIYSFALTAQALHPAIQRNIPRPILTIFATAVYVALAIPGASSFYHAFENLLLLLAYWLSIYATIAFIEHFIFKRGRFSNWNFDALHHPGELPLGLASLISLCIGFAGAMLGCSTTWWVGPVGKSFGLQPFGGDIGFEMAIGFTAITYPVLRYVERKYKR